ncbi:DnaJ domain-containing protein [Yoonia sp.]|uniref:DnaJ domain-containing protein n=1 Tax=Yoonia sp. TaxID=2212373 RepID=UPI004048BF40
MTEENFYKTLEVATDATGDQIKRAYRKMAKKYHPDVNSAPDAETSFKAAGAAYKVLGDPVKRLAYDRFVAEKTHATHGAEQKAQKAKEQQRRDAERKAKEQQRRDAEKKAKEQQRRDVEQEANMEYLNKQAFMILNFGIIDIFVIRRKQKYQSTQLNQDDNANIDTPRPKSKILQLVQLEKIIQRLSFYIAIAFLICTVIIAQIYGSIWNLVAILGTPIIWRLSYLILNLLKKI